MWQTALREDDDRLRELIACRPAKPWQILAITFTNKAAGELERAAFAMLGRMRRTSRRPPSTLPACGSCAGRLSTWGMDGALPSMIPMTPSG